MEEQWTILKVLEWTTGYFGRKHIEQPRANAEVLLAQVLGMERIQLYLRYDQPLTAEELARYRAVVQRRAAHEPTQYITGRQEFWSLEFDVTPAVLIPRPETERLVETALELRGEGPATVLDLGTGSGAIAISLAHERPSFHIVATDRSPAALSVAQANAVRHKVRERIFFVAMDLFDAFSPASPLFDLILSNPPYVGDEEFRRLTPEISEHEPRGALLGGSADGLDTIRKILKQAPSYVKPGGSILIEIGQDQSELLRQELPGHPGVASFEFIRDYSGILRVLHLRTPQEVEHG